VQGAEFLSAIGSRVDGYAESLNVGLVERSYVAVCCTGLNAPRTGHLAYRNVGLELGSALSPRFPEIGDSARGTLRPSPVSIHPFRPDGIVSWKKEGEALALICVVCTRHRLIIEWGRCRVGQTHSTPKRQVLRWSSFNPLLEGHSLLR